MNKRIGLIVPTVALLVFGAAMVYRLWPADSAASPVAATVDGTAISSRDLDIRLAQILPAASFHGNIEPSRLLGLKRAALDELILDELIYREALKRRQSADAPAVEKELQKARQRFATVEEYESALAENGMTESAFQRFTARSVLVRQARQARAEQTVTDAEAEEYYRANARKFLRPEQIHLLELLIKVDPTDPGSVALAERKARILARRIRAGEPFGRLARDYSDDDYRVKDGDFGLVHRGRLDADLESAVFAARPGEVSLARSVYGFHVFMVLERQPETQLTFAEASATVVERLASERRQQSEREWHAELRRAAKITILDNDLRSAPPAPLPAFRSVKTMRSVPDGPGNTTR